MYFIYRLFYCPVFGGKLNAKDFYPTEDEDRLFRLPFVVGSSFYTERLKIYSQLRYPKDIPSEHNKGTRLVWDCESALSKALHEHSAVKAELDNVQTIIQNWLIENPSIEGLYDDISEFGTRTTNPNLSSMPLWAFQAFGGTQGRKIEIKHITRNNSCLLQPNKIGYDIEILFTIYDTFGNGKNDAKKWWFPGLVSLWVLQHYRNFDCGDKAPCYIPITNHEIQILHKISVCADVP